MSDLYIKVKKCDDEGWVRPSEWLTMPTVNETDNIMHLLFLVFEDEYNEMTLQLGISQMDVDWGDGSGFNIGLTGGVTHSNVYNYNALGGVINVDPLRGNYKQVIITVLPGTTTAQRGLFLDRNTGINNNGEVHIVDIVYCFADRRINIVIGQQKRLTMLKIFKSLNVGQANTTLSMQFANIEIFDVGTQNLRVGVFQDNIINSRIENLFSNSFNGSLRTYVKEVGNLRGSRNSFNNFRADTVDSLTIFQFVNSGWSTIGSSNFQFTGEVDVEITIGSMNGTFTNSATRKLIVNNLATQVPNANPGGGSNLVTNMSNLQECELRGWRYGFSVANSKLTDVALNTLFTSLGTAINANQVITITGTPGANTADLSIATAKGYAILN